MSSGCFGLARKSILVGGGAALSLTLEMREFVLASGNIPDVLLRQRHRLPAIAPRRIPAPKPASCRYMRSCQACGSLLRPTRTGARQRRAMLRRNHSTGAVIQWSNGKQGRQALGSPRDARRSTASTADARSTSIPAWSSASASRTNARPRRANDLLPQRYPRRQADQHIDRLLL